MTRSAPILFRTTVALSLVWLWAISVEVAHGQITCGPQVVEGQGCGDYGWLCPAVPNPNCVDVGVSVCGSPPNAQSYDHVSLGPQIFRGKCYQGNSECTNYQCYKCVTYKYNSTKDPTDPCAQGNLVCTTTVTTNTASCS